MGLLNHPDIGTSDLTSIKLCLSGSAPLPQEVITQFEEKTGSTIIEAFGMTESSPARHRMQDRQPGGQEPLHAGQ